MQGSIDRLVLLRGGGKLIGADVVDFKTDQVSSDKALAAKVAFYRPQMEAYLRAAARLTRLPADRITGRLLFVSTGQVVPI